MPDFTYEVLTPEGQVERGITTADDERDAEEQLRTAGRYVVSLAPAPPRKPPKRTDGEIDRRQLIAFFEYLSGATQVGTPILTTLYDVEPRLESKKLRKIILEVRAAMSEEGKSLSSAMAAHPKAFPQFFISTIEAGEASGQLDFVLQQLVEQLDWQETIASQIRQATMYPTIVLTAIAGLVAVLIGFVFPRLVPVLTGRGEQLPLATRVVIAVSTALQQYWLLALAVVALIAVGLWLVRRSEGGRLRTDRLLLRAPVFGDLIMQLNMARFVTYLALFYRTGVEIIYSLTLVERLVTNRVVANAIRTARDQIIGGETIATAFGRAPGFPAMVIRALALGESTGRLDEALARTTSYYAREVPAAVRRFITALQPAMLALLGGAVLFVALAIFLPILGIYSSIGNR